MTTMLGAVGEALNVHYCAFVSLLESDSNGLDAYEWSQKAISAGEGLFGVQAFKAILNRVPRTDGREPYAVIVEATQDPDEADTAVSNASAYLRTTPLRSVA